MNQTPARSAPDAHPAETGTVVPCGGSRIAGNARLRFTVAQAVAAGRVCFHYQPVVRAGNPGFPAFYEMLARVELAGGKTLPAGAFMPLVEDSEIGRAIDRLALASALTELEANPRLRLSVNLSPRSMGDGEWLEMLGRASRSQRNVCGRLILEITEDAAIADAAQTADFMDHVRAMGPSFALDDFGAGATGFRHFREFRFDIAKIDGSYIQGIRADVDSQVLVKSLAGIAAHFDMMTVAERVEDPGDAEWLRETGIDCLQGYLFGRPAPAAELPGLPQAPRAVAG